MDASTVILRHAIMAWRDHQIIVAVGLINSAAISARQAFETAAKNATLRDSAWDPKGFTDKRIDALLNDEMRGPLHQFFKDAGAELAALSPGLTQLGSLFAQSGALMTIPGDLMPKSEAPPIAPIRQESLKDEGLFATIGGAIASKAASVAAYASETSDWLVQDKVGLRNRLRQAAVERIAMAWMGTTGDPEPVLGQLLRAINIAANEAKVTTQ